MKVGDLVRFKDISSMGENGKRMFPELNKRVGLVMGVRTDQSGNLMVLTDLEQRYLTNAGSTRGFNAMYFEVINGNR